MVNDYIILLTGPVIILAGLLFTILPRILYRPISVILPLCLLPMIWGFSTTITFKINWLSLAQHDVSPIFSSAFLIALSIGSLFAFSSAKRAEIVAAFCYAGGALTVLVAGSLFTFFIFWEIMALCSTIIVLLGGSDKSRNAALRYAIIHFLGGVILFAGICGSEFNSIGEIRLDSISSWLIFIGVLVNIAAPPFSSWLADSYPEASSSGSVFLSAFTTKTAVFALIILFPAQEYLIYIGLFMVFYGIIMAILENDMRRILSYSIVNQVGFMTTAIGIGTDLAIMGAAAHAFCHIIYKALLLMSAGAVLHRTGKSKCSELGGLYRTMPLTMICGTIGALAISAFPFTSGFVSKSLISEAAHIEHMELIYYLLLAASAGVFFHAGIKFPWFVFFQKDSLMRPKEAPLDMSMAMIIMSALCIIPGIFPELVYNMLPGDINYEPNTAHHIIMQLQLLCFAGLAFFICLPLLKRTNTIVLDFDFLYRVIGLKIYNKIISIISLISNIFSILWNYVVLNIQAYSYKLFQPRGILSRGWSLASMTFIMLVMFCGVLLLYYLN